MPAHDCIYDKLRKFGPDDSLKHGSYKCFSSGDGWYGFQHAKFDKNDLTGLKFHLPIDFEDVPRATDILLEISEKHQIKSFKAANHSYAINVSTPGNDQIGKSFVLYDTGQGNWKEILQDIEDGFQKAHPPIQPAREKDGTIAYANTDRPIQGSKYIAYRNDGNKGGRGAAFSSDEIRSLPPEIRHNPSREPDPYENFKIKNDQLHIPPTRNYAQTIRSQTWKTKTSQTVLGFKAGDLPKKQLKVLSEQLTTEQIGNRLAWSDPLQAFMFEVDCKDATVLQRAQKILNSHGVPQPKRKDNVTVMGVDTNNLNPIQEESLLRALEAEGFKSRQVQSAINQSKIIEIGAREPKDLQKLQSILSDMGTYSGKHRNRTLLHTHHVACIDQNTAAQERRTAAAKHGAHRPGSILHRRSIWYDKDGKFQSELAKPLIKEWSKTGQIPNVYLNDLAEGAKLNPAFGEQVRDYVGGMRTQKGLDDNTLKVYNQITRTVSTDIRNQNRRFRSAHSIKP